MQRRLSQYPLAIQAAPRGLQSIIAALLDNVEKALGCKPVRIGKEGLETFVYRGDVANNALKTAGQELGLFLEKTEVSHRYAKYDELTEAELIRQIRDEAQLLLEHHEWEMAGGLIINLPPTPFSSDQPFRLIASG